jgi:probable F420-dependent oxidoreductase
VELGVFLPISGRAASPEVLTEAAGQAERLGFHAVWSADRVVTPWTIRTPYPYSEDSAFIVPPDRPFLDSMSCLAFLAGCTSRVKLGISVLVLPYRHPLYWTRVAVTIDRLSRGRFILGVGCGWMAEEFAALGVPFERRGRATDEALAAARLLRERERIDHDGESYRFQDVAFSPKPSRGLATWVGGEGRAARRRAARFGDAWFPYFVSITVDDLRSGYEEVRRLAAEAGRDPDSVRLAACRPVEVTPGPVPQDPSRLRGSPEQLAEALRAHAEAGVDHLALQFMAGRWPEREAQIERFAREAMPAVQP